MKKLTVTTPRGIFTRTTHRTYTHLVLFLVGDTIIENTWAGRPDLAQKASLPSWFCKGKNVTKEVYPVDQ